MERRRREEGVGARWRREGLRLRLWWPSEGRGGPGGARPGKRRRAGLWGAFRVGETVEVALGAEQRGAGVGKGRGRKATEAGLEKGGAERAWGRVLMGARLELSWGQWGVTGERARGI